MGGGCYVDSGGHCGVKGHDLSGDDGVTAGGLLEE